MSSYQSNLTIRSKWKLWKWSHPTPETRVNLLHAAVNMCMCGWWGSVGVCEWWGSVYVCVGFLCGRSFSYGRFGPYVSAGSESVSGSFNTAITTTWASTALWDSLGCFQLHSHAAGCKDTHPHTPILHPHRSTSPYPSKSCTLPSIHLSRTHTHRIPSIEGRAVL